jgi:hypothetical protein
LRNLSISLLLSLMTVDQFWNLIDRIHSASEGDMDKKCALLKHELLDLPVPEVVSYQAHFDEAIDTAYTWPLWGVAFIMNGGCSDDSFMDFRATLISMGRETYEAAVEHPDSLATLEIEMGEEFIYEGFQYVPAEVLEKVAPGQKFPRYQSHPKTPAGTRWEEHSVNHLFPRVSEKYADM